MYTVANYSTDKHPLWYPMRSQFFPGINDTRSKATFLTGVSLTIFISDLLTGERK